MLITLLIEMKKFEAKHIYYTLLSKNVFFQNKQYK